MSKIHHQAQLLDENCSRCQACVAQCAFLQKNGTPGDIAASLLAGDLTIDPFACSLCTLCTAICPTGVAPGAFFLEMRRQVAGNNLLPLKPYAPILGYEHRGGSRLFSRSALPAGCTTVFFPGCSLPGTRPEATWWIYQQLKKQIPHLGIVLDCCHKLSHDLGRQRFFLEHFAAIQNRLISNGVRHIIVACPNCYKIFQGYGQDMTVRTAWEILADAPLNTTLPAMAKTEVTVHDPCPLRDHQEAQQAVRTLITRHDLEIREMHHSESRTICCGEGGSVGFVQPDLARRWGEICKEEAGNKLVITYCAGCAGFLTRAGLKTVHLADLLVNPQKALAGQSTAARAPWTYLNRIRLKRRLQKAMRTSNQGRT